MNSVTRSFGSFLSMIEETPSTLSSSVTCHWRCGLKIPEFESPQIPDSIEPSPHKRRADFRVIDLASGYFRMKEKESSWITAFGAHSNAIDPVELICGSELGLKCTWWLALMHWHSLKRKVISSTLGASFSGRVSRLSILNSQSVADRSTSWGIWVLEGDGTTAPERESHTPAEFFTFLGRAWRHLFF